MKPVFFFCILLSSVISTLAFAGGHEAGNGGGAWVCRNPDGSIRWAELIDLIEAQGEFGLDLVQYSGSYVDIVNQVEQRVSLISEGMTTDIDSLHDLIPNNETGPSKIIWTHDGLPIINDSLFMFAPSLSECIDGQLGYEQVVNYQDNDQIIVQQEVFNALSDLSKAALVLHEGIYLYRRQVAWDTNSIVTRRLVGLVSSSISQSELQAEIAGMDSNLPSLPSGQYVFNFKVMDSNGISTPPSNITALINGFFDPNPLPSGETIRSELFDIYYDDSGTATLTIPFRPGFSYNSPILDMHFNDVEYSNSLAAIGWATALQSRTSSYGCEEITLALPTETAAGRIDIVCAEGR